jgi:hypothetical protein
MSYPYYFWLTYLGHARLKWTWRPDITQYVVHGGWTTSPQLAYQQSHTQYSDRYDHFIRHNAFLDVYEKETENITNTHPYTTPLVNIVQIYKQVECNVKNVEEECCGTETLDAEEGSISTHVNDICMADEKKNLVCFCRKKYNHLYQRRLHKCLLFF